jgi:tripartite-type tricarboxylate transporter receptor subunit TctC
VRANSTIRSLQDLVDTAKRQNLNAGSGGNGTAHHLTLELFKNVTGAPIQHIPYKGGAQAMTDLLGGQIDVIFSLLPECLPHIKSGKLQALAVTSDARHPLLPDVPTTAEAGIPGVSVTSWNGLMVPSGTPKEIVSKINADVLSIIAAPEMRARIIEQGFQPGTLSVSDTEKFVKADVERWAKVIREAHITAD